MVGYASLMMGICPLACVVPTGRALAVELTEALRPEGRSYTPSRIRLSVALGRMAAPARSGSGM